MKRKRKKFLSEKEYRELFVKGNEIVFSETSPFSAIYSPHAIFVGRHWDLPSSGRTTGTTYIVRAGAFPVDYDMDVTSLLPPKSEKDLPEIKHIYTEYHHIDSMQSLMRAPEQVRNKIIKLGRFGFNKKL